MGLLDRLRGLFQEPPLPQVRVDSAAAESPFRPRLHTQSRQDSLLNELTGLGGAFDKGASSRPYTGKQRLNEEELVVLYLNNGISQKIVNLIPEEATRKGW
jgi:hypothetical protein